MQGLPGVTAAVQPVGSGGVKLPWSVSEMFSVSEHVPLIGKYKHPGSSCCQEQASVVTCQVLGKFKPACLCQGLGMRDCSPVALPGFR